MNSSTSIIVGLGDEGNGVVGLLVTQYNSQTIASATYLSPFISLQRVGNSFLENSAFYEIFTDVIFFQFVHRVAICLSRSWKIYNNHQEYKSDLKAPRAKNMSGL